MNSDVAQNEYPDRAHEVFYKIDGVSDAFYLKYLQ